MRMSNNSGVWQYLGPGGGAGMKHIIVDSSCGWLTTWSEPTDIIEVGSDIAGWSWFGPMDAFHREFRRVG